MVRPLGSRSIAGAVAAAVLITVSLTACAQTAPQSKEHSSTAGISATVQDVGIRNAYITLNADGTGELNLALFNQGDSTDTLTGVTPGASGAFGSALLPTNTEVANAADNEVSGLPAVSDSTEGISLPTTAGVFLDQPPAQIALSGFPAGTLVGASVPVTLTFANAGTITLQVPIASGDSVTASPSAG